MSLGTDDNQSDCSRQKSRKFCYQQESSRSDKPRCSLTRQSEAENSPTFKKNNLESRTPISKKNSVNRMSSSFMIHKGNRSLISVQHSDSDIIQPTQDTSPRMSRQHQPTNSERLTQCIKDPVMPENTNANQVSLNIMYF